MHDRIRILLAVVPWLLVTTAMQAAAQIRIEVAPDVTLELGSNHQVVDDGHVANGGAVPSPVWVEPLTGVPAGAAIAAYDVLDDGVGATRLFSFESDVELPGGLVARRGDVVAVLGSGSYSMQLDVSTIGIPNGVVTDALASVGTALFLSFDRTIDLGGGIVAADEDLVRWDGAAFALAFDGSAAGLDPAIDLDAVDRTGNAWAFSFDTGGEVSGIPFADDDVLTWSPATGAWNPVPIYRGAAIDSDWESGDVAAIAVPEANALAMAATGVMLVSLLARRRHGVGVGSA